MDGLCRAQGAERPPEGRRVDVSWTSRARVSRPRREAVPGLAATPLYAAALPKPRAASRARAREVGAPE